MMMSWKKDIRQGCGSRSGRIRVFLRGLEPGLIFSSYKKLDPPCHPALIYPEITSIMLRLLLGRTRIQVVFQGSEDLDPVFS